MQKNLQTISDPETLALIRHALASIEETTRLIQHSRLPRQRQGARL
jgi:hypothetical protein